MQHAQGTRGFVFQPRQESFRLPGTVGGGGATKRVRAENDASVALSSDIQDELCIQHWDCMETFENFTVWNYDQAPSNTDEMRRWTDWVKISAAMAQ